MDLHARSYTWFVSRLDEGRELTGYRIAIFNLSEFIDFFVSSCFVHIRKPDRNIFQVALDISQAIPNKSVYINDREMFLTIAAEFGMQGVHHVTHHSTRSILHSLGLEP